MSNKELKGKAYAELDNLTGVLRIFRDGAGKYRNRQTDGTKTYYAGIENITRTTHLNWTYDNRSVTKVIIEDAFKPKTAYGMFRGMENLTEIEGIENLDMSECTNMSCMFQSCKNLTELDVSGFNTSNVTDMGLMFCYCNNLENLDVSHFDTSKVTDMECMFSNCEKLTELDLSNFDTSKVEYMGQMFAGCSNLGNLDLSSFDTFKVTDMRGMFYACKNLTELNLSNFDTSDVYDMELMFSDCSSLTKLDVSHFDTSECTDMNSMFKGCENLTELDLSSFDTSKVTDMAYMFCNCRSLTELDLNSFDDSTISSIDENVVDDTILLGTDRMFLGCDDLKKLHFPVDFALNDPRMEIPIGCEVHIGDTNSSEADELYNMMSEIKGKYPGDNSDSEDIENQKDDDVWE